MGQLLNSLQEYFKNTPQKQLDEDWEEVKELNEVGPTIDDYMEIKSPFESFDFPDKDLTNIFLDKGYSDKCPFCNKEVDGDESYIIDGQSYPQYYNEVLISTPDGTIHDWEELYVCPHCKKMFKRTNGCF